MSAGLIVDSLAGVAQRAATITQAKAIDPLLAKSLCKTKNGSIVRFLGLLDPLLIVVAANLPNRLQHQCPLSRFQPFLHFLYCAAIRRTRIVGIILTAEIIFAELSKGRVLHNICRINKGCRETSIS